ncbi:glycosyltransferase [Nitrosopumilus sp. K4]|uniref:glycosyltransferase n=1 Tax=Nitrosopumilus sp. K4 TaxID=2795383 RepID=UPI001BADEA84|nr:glycosyltransferase family 2 protein [Nitrosopumilus sp. K4]QUC63888.1 glycosyltransferase [Nitrosopumilus sp. K4]
MELAVDIFNYVFTSIMIGIAVAWMFLIKSMLDSFRHTPYLDKFEKTNDTTPKVSIILPARNEEEHIGKCLESLINQNYKNYEIIVINDSSEDNTEKIISEYGKKDSKIIHVNAQPKPEGWMGKNWACMEGYKKATGELLLFTDADTKHKETVISLAVAHLLSFDLDALSVIPKMLSFDFWTKITLPMISTFLHTRFSALKVNDPAKNTGYFFGSFFIIKKKTYDEVGTHEGVKQEIIEDGALGKKVKEQGYKIKMVRGEHLISAVWARDRTTLWNALKRLMIPLYLQSGGIAIGIFFAVLFLLFMPFPFTIYSAVFALDSISFSVLFATSTLSSILIYTGSVIEVKKALFLKLKYSVFAPIGSLVVVFGFLAGLVQAKSSSSVSWRGRSYSMKDHVQSSISV